jgi:hypothetical protein
MAGQPIRRKLVAQLEREAAALSEERGEQLSVLDVVFERVSGGEKMGNIGLELAKKCDLKISFLTASSVLSAWVNKQDGGREMLAQARAEAAHALAEESVELADDVSEDKQAIAKAKLQSDNRQWLASKWNRKAYGQDAQIAVNTYNLGALHIDALRQRRIEDSTPAAAIEGQDYEVLSHTTSEVVGQLTAGAGNEGET